MRACENTESVTAHASVCESKGELVDRIREAASDCELAERM